MMTVNKTIKQKKPTVCLQSGPADEGYLHTAATHVNISSKLMLTADILEHQHNVT